MLTNIMTDSRWYRGLVGLYGHSWEPVIYNYFTFFEETSRWLFLYIGKISSLDLICPNLHILLSLTSKNTHLLSYTLLTHISSSTLSISLHTYTSMASLDSDGDLATIKIWYNETQHENVLAYPKYLGAGRIATMWYIMEI